MRAITANVTKPAPLPIPAFAERGSLNFFFPVDSELESIVGNGRREAGIVAAEVLAGDVFGKFIDDEESAATGTKL